MIFTDGACEQHGADVTFGAVMLEDETGPMEFFCLRVPPAVAERWGGAPGKQVVGQAELAPVVVAKQAWAARLRGRLVLHFVDNDSARCALVRGYSPVLSSCALVAEAALEDVRLHLGSWYARVPTLSNIADYPSRFERDKMLADYPGAKEVWPRLPVWWHGAPLPLEVRAPR